MSEGVLNPQQLKLFMTGTEWQDNVTKSTDQGSGESVGRVWGRKERESRQPATIKDHDVQWRGGRGVRVTINERNNGIHGAGLYDSIRDKGYRHEPKESDPPTILLDRSGNNIQYEGHHRVAAAAALERDTGKPTFIPTNYEDNRGY